MDLRSFMVGALLVALLALAYVFWEKQRDTVELKLPSISVEKR
jgi:hypothetical protein